MCEWAVKRNNCLPPWRFYLHALRQVVKAHCGAHLQAESVLSAAALGGHQSQGDFWGPGPASRAPSAACFACLKLEYS